MSRHECDARIPRVDKALAYELIFSAEVKNLFPRAHRAIEAVVKARARLLLVRVKYRLHEVGRARKVALLKRILGVRDE